MFMGDFKEATEDLATFPEDSPTLFEVLIEWVYTGKLRELKTHPVTKTINYSPELMYQLADKFCMEHLMDTIISAYILHYKQQNIIPNVEEMKLGYKIPGKPFRDLTVRFLHYLLTEFRQNTGTTLWSTKDIQEMLITNGDMFTDYLELVRSHPSSTTVNDPRQLPLCTFHLHGKNEECEHKSTWQ